MMIENTFMEEIMSAHKRNPYKSAWLYILGFLLAGALHVADALVVRQMLAEGPANSGWRAFASTALFVLNLAVYIFLLIHWMVSLYFRLLPSWARLYCMIAAVMMIFFLFDRTVKYRVALYQTALEHAAWYAYYLPLAIIPAMFLLTCLSAEPDTRARRLARRIVAAVCAALLLVVLTNDLHQLVFIRFTETGREGAWGTYYPGPFWYVFYGFIILCLIIGTVLLVAGDRKKNSGKRALPAVIVLFLMVAVLRFVDLGDKLTPWRFPETAVFCMLGIFECCIRTRLLPSNENYSEFFANVRFPVVITDHDLRTVYRTATGAMIPEGQIRLEAANEESLVRSRAELGNGRVLHGKPLKAGYVFFVSDESVLRAINDRLEDVADVLKGENELLRFENQQKEERAQIDARNAVYAQAEAEVYDAQKRIAVLLDSARPGTPDYRKYMARALLLTAYVKRKTNFVLAAKEQEMLQDNKEETASFPEQRFFSAAELFLALDESARFLDFCGIPTNVAQGTKALFSYAEVMALYDTFEAVIENLLELAKGLVVMLGDGFIRLLPDCPVFSMSENTPAKIHQETEDGQIYLTLRY